VKAQLNSGRRRELYYFRDQQGLEVTFFCLGAAAAFRWSSAKPRAPSHLPWRPVVATGGGAAKEPPARHDGRVASRTSIAENFGRNPRGRPRSARMGVAGFRQPTLIMNVVMNVVMNIVLRNCRNCLTEFS